jgi:hypothetical protein
MEINGKINTTRSRTGSLDYHYGSRNNNNNLNSRRLSETISITSPDEEHGNYDTEATISYPKTNFIGKVRNNLNRACQFLTRIDSTECNYGDYPLGNEYRFRDWETW